MNTQVKFSLLMSIALFLLGLVLGSIGIGLPYYEVGLSPVINLIVLSLGTFIFSILFFGKLTPLIFLYLGGAIALTLMVSPELAFIRALNAIPLFFAAWAGTEAGVSSKTDLEGEGNLFLNKNIGMLLLFSLILSSVFAFVFTA
ncbi:MAG TPA: hypothetical protein VJK05_02610 [archaeon]|nr:hypothetical protein [archaeon]